MKILYLGGDAGNSSHRHAAMRRLGHDVQVMDPWLFAPAIPGMARWCHHTGTAVVADIIAGRIARRLADHHFDLAWVESGEFVSAGLVRTLRAHARRVVNHNHDDPFGLRDGLRFRQYRAAVKEYDLVAVVRECNIAEARAAGARNIIRIYRSADEVAHAPRRLTEADFRRWGSDVAFIGTWMPERGSFMRDLMERSVPLSIFGNRWQRAPEWNAIRKAWRGPAADTEEEYARAVQCAKICLGLVSKENRDLHTTRSLEIPALGSLFLAERTGEHMALYREDAEAVFWSDAAECAAKCHALLADEPRIRTIAAAGHARGLANGHYNEKAITQILAAAMEAGTVTNARL
jgi:hypothetical protein